MRWNKLIYCYVIRMEIAHMQSIDFFNKLVMFCLICVSCTTNTGYLSQLRDFVKEYPRETIFVSVGIVGVTWYANYYAKKVKKAAQIRENERYEKLRGSEYDDKDKKTKNLDQFKLVMGINESNFANLSDDDRKRFIDANNKTFKPHVWEYKSNRVKSRWWEFWKKESIIEQNILVPCYSKATYPYGTFAVFNLLETNKKDADFEEDSDTEEDVENNSKNGLIFNIVTRTRDEDGNKYEDLVNITSLLSQSEYNGAFVQVASRFNCLEGMGRGVSHYTNSSEGFVQGESVATATLPASIYRYHFCDEVNLLSDIKINSQEIPMYYGLPTYDGYTSIANCDWSKQSNDEKGGEWWRNIMVGLHTEVTPILTDISPRGPANVEARITNNHGQQVTLVLTSALNLSNSRIGHIANLNKAKGKKKEKINTKENLETFAKGCLMASYHYTLSAASQRVKDTSSRQKVLLTMMGGGVFENKTQWIVDAIQKSLEAHKNSPIDVTLILYFEPRHNPNYLTRLKSFVSAYNGSYSVNGEVVCISSEKKDDSRVAYKDN